MHPWIVRSRKVAFEQKPWIAVELHEVELPDGSVIPEWTWVVTPDFVNVIAVTPDQAVICIRQEKYAIDGLSLAPIGGYIDQGETALEAAKREMMEETGLVADDWRFLGKYAADGNRGAGHGHLFLALDVRKVSNPSSDDLERSELVSLSMDEFEQAILSGEFKLLPWIANAALALLHLRRS
ncbi:MAG: NUDIX hydrolase [Pirellula sp.]